MRNIASIENFGSFCCFARVIICHCVQIKVVLIPETETKKSSRLPLELMNFAKISTCTSPIHEFTEMGAAAICVFVACSNMD